MQSSHNSGAMNGSTPDGCATTLEPIDALGPIDYRDTLGPTDTLILYDSLDDSFALNPNDSLISYSSLSDPGSFSSNMTHYLQYL